MTPGMIPNLCKTLSELRKKLQSAGFANAETLVPQRGNPVTFPMGKNCDKRMIAKCTINAQNAQQTFYGKSRKCAKQTAKQGAFR